MRIPYKIYSRDDIDIKVEEEGAIVHFHDERTRQCWLVLRLRYIGQMAHVGFYAASTGWEFLTSTGYHSFFVEKGAAEYFKDDPAGLLQFLCEYTGLEHCTGDPVQCSLF